MTLVRPRALLSLLVVTTTATLTSKEQLDIQSKPKTLHVPVYVHCTTTT